MAYKRSKARAGRGTCFAIGGIVDADDQNTFLRIGETRQGPIKAPKWGTTPVTNFDSADAAEFLSTIKDDGSCSPVLNYVQDDPGQLKLEDAAGDGELYQFAVQLPSSGTSIGRTVLFAALVLSVGDLDLQPTKEITRSVDLKISGDIEFQSPEAIPAWVAA